MGDCLDIFKKIASYERRRKLPLTALFLLLRENPELRRMSVERLARFCGVAARTVHEYLEELDSYKMIKFSRNETTEILYDNNLQKNAMIEEFAESLSSDYVWNPFVEAQLSPNRAEWKKWLLRIAREKDMYFCELTSEQIKSEFSTCRLRRIWRLLKSQGVVLNQNDLQALPGDFLLLEFEGKQLKEGENDNSYALVKIRIR